ncbi:YwiB family protein [Enterococcus faecalis]
MDLSTGVPVSIQLKTIVQQGNEQKDFFFDLEGQLVKMGDILYIRYKEELLEDTEPTPVTIKIEPDGHVQLIRAGELRMRLRFGYQEKLDTSYRTPYGLLQISTFTHNLRVSLKDQPMSGKILVDYDLYSQTERIGEYHLELEFTA